MRAYGSTNRWQKERVEVIARFTTDAYIIPTEIVWKDGRRFPIDSSTLPCRGLCPHTGGNAIRYEVTISGQTKNLFRDDRGWFVEVFSKGLD